MKSVLDCTDADLSLIYELIGSYVENENIDWSFQTIFFVNK